MSDDDRNTLVDALARGLSIAFAPPKSAPSSLRTGDPVEQQDYDTDAAREIRDFAGALGIDVDESSNR